MFGDEQSATHRLSTPLAILEYRTPTELLASDEGIELVERALDRNRECRTGSKRYGAMQSSACSDTSAINLHVSE